MAVVVPGYMQIALDWLLQRQTISTLVISARNEEKLRSSLGAVC